MNHRHASFTRLALLGLALAALPLTGCTTAGFSSSAYGSAQPELTTVAGIGNYTSDQALAAARGHFKNNDFGYSAALYKRVVELSPQDPEGYIGLGASYDQLRRFDLSDRVYVALFKMSGGTAQYYNNVGYSYMLRGDLKSAYDNFKKAQSLAPGNPVVANNLKILANAAAKAHA